MKKTFAEVVLLARTGLNPRKNFKLGQGNNNYITIKNIKNNTLVIDENTDVVDDEAIKLIHKRSKIKKGDILFASIGRMGDMYIIENDPVGWDINESVFAFTLDTNIVRQKYFYYIFRVKSTLDYLASNSSGSTFKSIKMNQLKKMTFDIPPLEKQDQIVATLDKVCNVIEMRKQELISLDDLIKARFVEMFGDENNSRNWNVVNVEEVADVQVGVVIKPSQYYTDESNGVKAFRSLNIGAGFIKDIDWAYFTKEGHLKNSKSILKENDLLIVRSGAPGTACVVTEEFAGCNAVDVIIAHLDCEKVNPYYLCTFTNMPHGKKQINEGTGGAAQQHFNVGKYNKLRLMLPPKMLQDEFAVFIQQVNKSKVAVQKALDETQLLFNSLMQEYFG